MLFLETDLTAAEQRLLAAARGGVREIFDPDAAEESRTIRPEVLRALLTDGVGENPRALAWVAFDHAIIAEGLDMRYARRALGAAPLAALDVCACEFRKGVQLDDAYIEMLNLHGCTIASFSAKRLRVAGDLSLASSTVAGSLLLSRAQIGGAFGGAEMKVAGAVNLDMVRVGEVSLNRAEVAGKVTVMYSRIDGNMRLDGMTVGDGTTAVCVAGCEIRGALRLRVDAGQRFVGHGEVNAVNATIRAGIEIEGALISRGKGLYALDLARLDTDGCVFIEGQSKPPLPFVADGAIDLSGARIGGYARIKGVRISPTIEPQHPDVHGLCLDLSETRITSSLEMCDIRGPDGATPPAGVFRFESTSVGVLADNPETAWPGDGLLKIIGFNYDLIRALTGASPAEGRVAWLQKQYAGATPGLAEFSPQPFEQLAGALRKMGYGTEADNIAVMKRRLSVESGGEPQWSRWVSRFMYVTSRHGYSPVRAMAWTTAYWLLGVLALMLALLSGLTEMVPAGAKPADWQGIAYVPAILGQAEHGCPAGVIPLYTLELIVPGLDLGQANACELYAEGREAGWFGALRAAYQIVGGVLTAVFVTTLTGVLRRD